MGQHPISVRDRLIGNRRRNLSLYRERVKNLLREVAEQNHVAAQTAATDAAQAVEDIREQARECFVVASHEKKVGRDDLAGRALTNGDQRNQAAGEIAHSANAHIWDNPDPSNLESWRTACIAYATSHAMFYAFLEHRDVNDDVQRIHDAEKVIWESIDTIDAARGRAKRLLLEFDDIYMP